MTGSTIQSVKAERFDAAREAMSRLVTAQAELQRLAKYRRLNPAMRDDQSKWAARESQARVDLAHALRFDPEIEPGGRA